LAENRGEYFLYWPRFSGNMTKHYASKMRAGNYAALPKSRYKKMKKEKE
jgi:hypothetical protein